MAKKEDVPKIKTFGSKRYSLYVCVGATAAGKRFMTRGAKEMREEDGILTRVVKIGSLYCLYIVKRKEVKK